MYRLEVDKTGRQPGTRGSYDLPLMGGQECIDITDYDGGAFACHFHDEPELTLIARGEMYYRVEDKEYIVREGDAVFVGSGVMHAGRSKDGAPCLYSPMNFWPLFISGHEGSYIDRHYVAPMQKEGYFPGLVLRADAPEDEEALAQVRALYAALTMKEPGRELLVKAALCRLWYLFFRRFQAAGTPAPTAGVTVIKAAISHIEVHYAQALTLDDLAAVAHLSRSEFCRAFRRLTGTTAFAYLQYHRVRRSLPLLQNRTLSVTAVAEQVGFASGRYYAEIFRRYMNMSPLEYRKKYL